MITFLSDSILESINFFLLFKVSNYIRDQEQGAGVDPLSDTQHNEMVSDIFKHEDKDKDGLISHEEFSGPKHDEL